MPGFSHGSAPRDTTHVVGGIVIAPICGMLHRPGAGNRSFESGGLGDEPIRHIATVTVATDGKAVRIGDAIFYQGVDAFQYVLPGRRPGEEQFAA